VKHALSFDIEDWFHIVDIPELEDRTLWDSRPTIVEKKTDLILSILDEFESKATFFVLGWVAKKYPNISKKIVKAGHELGTHSYWHRRVYELKPKEFYEDLKQSIEILEQQTGSKVRGFRAPSFSIIPGSEWAFDVLLELGLVYDASLFPAKRGHGGYDSEQKIHSINRECGSLLELPMSVLKKGKMKIPFSGGGYLRVLPYTFIRHAFKKFEESDVPVVVYLHPRDFAPECPRVKMSAIRRFKSYTGLDTTEKKLRTLLTEFKFDTCSNVISSTMQR
jgi:polysaccharide deacetylase family protein (PEP-CTERM system associated)